MANLAPLLLIGGLGAVVLAVAGSRKPSGPRKELEPETEEELGLKFTGGMPTVPAIPWEGEPEPGARRVPAEVEQISISRTLTAVGDNPDGEWGTPIVRRVVVGTLPKNKHATAIVRACVSRIHDRGAGAQKFWQATHDIYTPRVLKQAWPRSWIVRVDDRGDADITNEQPGRRATPCPSGYELRRGGQKLSEWNGEEQSTKGNHQLLVDGGALVLRVVIAPEAMWPSSDDWNASVEGTVTYNVEVDGVITWAAD